MQLLFLLFFAYALIIPIWAAVRQNHLGSKDRPTIRVAINIRLW